MVMLKSLSKLSFSLSSHGPHPYSLTCTGDITVWTQDFLRLLEHHMEQGTLDATMYGQWCSGLWTCLPSTLGIARDRDRDKHTHRETEKSGGGIRVLDIEKEPG